MIKLAQGDNFEVTQESTALHLRVFKRPDQTLDKGARNAGDMMGEISQLLQNHSELTGLVLNLLDAPVAGPKTRDTLAGALQEWSEAGKRVAVLVDHPAMKMMFTRLLQNHVGDEGHIFGRVREAMLWCVGMSLESIQESSSQLSRIEPENSGLLD